MARPQVDIDATKSRILEICEEMIRERGAISFTMKDIAQAADMSQSNVYRFFESKDDLAEAMAERWFEALNVIMEDVVASDLPARDKMYAFFARRMELKHQRLKDDPSLFAAYMELGNEHFEVVRGYIDLADHFMAVIIAEAMEEGYFKGLEIDETVSIMNSMVQPYCNPMLMMQLHLLAGPDKLAIVIDTIFDGLNKPDIPIADNDRAVRSAPKLRQAI